MNTLSRIRYLAAQLGLAFIVLALACAGVYLGDQIAHSLILWGLGGFVGAIAGFVVLWVIQPMLDRG